MNIAKLRKEYQLKITEQDELINILTIERRELRKGNFQEMFPDDKLIAIQQNSCEMQITGAKRQCYIQFIHDLDSLEDD